jgi:1A family penicillin-binding protein
MQQPAEPEHLMRSHIRPIRLGGALAFFLSLFLAAAAGAYWLLAGVPPLDGPEGSRGLSLYAYAAAPSSKVYDRYGRLLYEMPPPHTGSHTPVPLSDVPLALRQAIIATEDATFYENPGVDAWAVLRAVWINLHRGEVLSGASTLTQQLARNLLLSPQERYERTLSRKLREAVLAWRITQHYSKDQILELYLNEIYFGNMAYGVEAAAQAYFGKAVGDLDLAEAALLAGLPQAPAYYNPLENLDGAKARQAVVLELMVKQGHITEAEARLAKNEKLYFASAPFDIRAPHFVMYVRGTLEQELGLERIEQGGLHVHTTLDLDLTEASRDRMRYRLSRLAECHGQRTNCPPGGHNVRNAALVALDPRTGEILVMVGSPDYFSARIDGAVNGTTAPRQPGSSIKPVTYAAAFARGDLTPATMMLDVRTSFQTAEGTPYVPLNYDRQFRGPVRLRESLASSYNLIAVKVLDAVGVETMTSLARSLGMTTFDEIDKLGLAVTLGGGEVRLLEETAAYAAFANGGYVIRPHAISRVEDEAGNVLWSPGPGVGDRVLDERVAYLISDVLSDDRARIPSFGEASVLRLTRPAAVKTGTSTDFRDNWTVGYTPELVVGVWAGNADNEPMLDVSGISAAAPIWHDVMELALNGQPVQSFRRPEGLVEVEVCALSGLLPEPDCPHRVKELFVQGTEPTQACTMHRRIAIDRATGLRATGATPPERIVERVYAVLPPEAEDWARQQGIPEPPPASRAESPLSDPGSQLARVDAPVEEQEMEAPLLKMSSPDRGVVYLLDGGLPRDAQRIVISAYSEKGVSMRKVTLWADGRLLANFSTPPYKTLWRLEPGKHSFWAEGISVGGDQVKSDEVQVRVRDR